MIKDYINILIIYIIYSGIFILILNTVTNDTVLIRFIMFIYTYTITPVVLFFMYFVYNNKKYLELLENEIKLRK